MKSQIIFGEGPTKLEAFSIIAFISCWTRISIFSKLFRNMYLYFTFYFIFLLSKKRNDEGLSIKINFPV